MKQEYLYTKSPDLAGKLGDYVRDLEVSKQDCFTVLIELLEEVTSRLKDVEAKD